MVALSPNQEYSRDNVLRMLDVKERQLRSWEKQGLISGGAVFSFADIIALRTLQKLRESRVPARTIGRALDSLRRKLAHVEKPLSELKILADGKRISVQVAGQKMEAISGQFLFDFEACELPNLTTFPGKLPVNRPSEAEAFFQQGLIYEETGAPIEQAIEAYESAIELNPKAAGALLNLGTIHFRQGKLASAESFYRKALEADPNYPLAHFNLGNLYDEQQDAERARTHYLSAVRLNPKYADAFFNLALLCEQTGDILKAVNYWNVYLKLDGTTSWAQVARRQLERLKQSTFVTSR